MNIVHAGWMQMGSVHGTHQALWQLARAQVAAGHQVSIVNVGWQVSADDRAAAARDGVRLVGVECPQWRRFWVDDGAAFATLLDELQPDLVHLQYVRIPKFYALSRLLQRRRIAYVISLHGGLKAAEMKRHAARKLAYWYLVERRVHRGAAAIHFISDAERDEYYQSLARPKPADAVIANVVEAVPGAPDWKGFVNASAPSFATLGRYDIWHKGLDLAAAMVRELRRLGVAAQLHLYGSAVGRFENEMAQLKQEYADLPLVDHGFVTGVDKYAAMAGHDFYLQYSRFELFGMALVEAGCIGVPLVLSEGCDLASQLNGVGAAIAIPFDPGQAARLLAQRLQDAGGCAAIGAQARRWASENCSAMAVARRMTQFYEAALAGPA